MTCIVPPNLYNTITLWLIKYDMTDLWATIAQKLAHKLLITINSTLNIRKCVYTVLYNDCEYNVIECTAPIGQSKQP